MASDTITTDEDRRALRIAFGAFMTGVTIVTTMDGDVPVGLTANSFTSVSLAPPLLLVCIARTSLSLPAFQQSKGFAVNILAKGQKALSNRFARPSDDRFQDVAWHSGPIGNPILDGACGWFDCRHHDQVEAGDHIILIGHVHGFDHPGGEPLGYARGDYF